MFYQLITSVVGSVTKSKSCKLSKLMHFKFQQKKIKLKIRKEYSPKKPKHKASRTHKKIVQYLRIKFTRKLRSHNTFANNIGPTNGRKSMKNYAYERKNSKIYIYTHAQPNLAVIIKNNNNNNNNNDKEKVY